jgi:hypothetical protein
MNKDYVQAPGSVPEHRILYNCWWIKMMLRIISSLRLDKACHFPATYVQTDLAGHGVGSPSIKMPSVTVRKDQDA